MKTCPTCSGYYGPDVSNDADDRCICQPQPETHASAPPEIRSTDWLGTATEREARKFIEKLVGKSWFEAWDLNDIRQLIRAALQHPRCTTCDGTGYQSIIGHPGCQGGCEACNGIGLAVPNDQAQVRRDE